MLYTDAWTAQTFRGQSTDDLRTEHGCSADRAWMFYGQSTDVLQTEHGCSADRARMFRRHSTAFLQLAGRQFDGHGEDVPRSSWIKVSYFQRVPYVHTHVHTLTLEP